VGTGTAGLAERMFIQRVEIAGLAAAPALDLSLDRVSHFSGAPRLRAGVADAISLAFAAWDRELFASLLTRWGCVDPVITGDPLPEAAHWTGAPGLSALLEPPEEALLTISLTLALDPPQYGRLRKEAVRDPRLVDALADGARLVVRIGARFSPGFDALALDPLAFIVGDAAFPISGSERPTWMTPFLRILGGRCARGPAPLRLWAERGASWRGADQRSLRRGLAALREPPIGLGEVLPLPDGLAVLEGDTLVPLALFGESARIAVGLAGTVHLSGADILLVDDPPVGWEGWFALQAEADASPLEQVILFGVPGGRPLA
jgi:hypothetical protein